MFTPIQKIVPKAVCNLGLKQQVEAAIVCEKYRKLAPRHLHVNALNHTAPKFFRNRILTIGVENPAWAAEISAHKDKLIKAINEALGEKRVKQIKTRVVERIGGAEALSDTEGSF